jgi:hypothetical protein
MKCPIEMGSGGMIYVHKDWYRPSNNIKVLAQKFEEL